MNKKTADNGVNASQNVNSFLPFLGSLPNYPSPALKLPLVGIITNTREGMNHYLLMKSFLNLRFPHQFFVQQ